MTFIGKTADFEVIFSNSRCLIFTLWAQEHTWLLLQHFSGSLRSFWVLFEMRAQPSGAGVLKNSRRETSPDTAMIERTELNATSCSSVL